MCIYAKVFAKRSYFALNTFSSLLDQISTALVFKLRFMQKGLGIEYIFVTFRSKIYLYLYIIMHVPKYQVIDNRYIYIRVHQIFSKVYFEHYRDKIFIFN